MTCNIPPNGWHCTRDQGHDGPCAAIPHINRWSTYRDPVFWFFLGVTTVCSVPVIFCLIAFTAAIIIHLFFNGR
jgi:hypothetical protein